MATRIYLHFGELPASGRSVCWTLTTGTWYRGSWWGLDAEDRAGFEAAGYAAVDGRVLEPGLSTFGLHPDALPDDEELGFSIADTDLEDVEDLFDRPAFLVSGGRLGAGFGGEPLIGGPTVLGGAELVRFDRRRGIVFVRRGS